MMLAPRQLGAVFISDQPIGGDPFCHTFIRERRSPGCGFELAVRVVLRRGYVCQRLVPQVAGLGLFVCDDVQHCGDAGQDEDDTEKPLHDTQFVMVRTGPQPLAIAVSFTHSSCTLEGCR